MNSTSARRSGVFRERMKKRKEHAVPLPTQAVEMLRALHGFTGRHVHLFPHRDDRTKPMVSASFRQMLNVLGWGKYSPHATRTTGSTTASLGFFLGLDRASVGPC